MKEFERSKGLANERAKVGCRRLHGTPPKIAKRWGFCEGRDLTLSATFLLAI